jgi:hypothetical protein
VYLTEHFSKEELCHSNTAIRLGLQNEPNQVQLTNLYKLAEGLEHVRSKLGGLPIIISSGFRSMDVNRAVGSKDTSFHTYGLAADFICPRYGSVDDVFHAVVSSSIEYDQLIKEFDRWIHIGFPKGTDKPRRQSLIIDKTGVKAYV